jgi:eukaryotic-like serine/threonine-protein kinase
MQPGTRLGSYEIVSALGTGGMGEVWKARDTQLHRDVAIKTLPEEFTHDEHRLARFEREARLLASLNHRNIAAIYGLEELEGRRFLVLELVEGDTLADRIQRGAIPVEEVLALTSQIAEAVEAAHEKGVVHRDLKPANIKVTPDRTVKVLDFGLAKNVGEPAAGVAYQSTTETVALTVPGAVMGTAPYMSPEQARGQPTDKRTDIWSFGAVLYEMLTGRRAFSGHDASTLVARILERDPDFDALPPDTPPVVRQILRRCLTKDPRERLRDIGDARIDLHQAAAAGQGGGDAGTGGRRSLRAWAYVGAALVLVGLLSVGVTWYVASGRDGRADLPSRLELTLPRGLVTRTVATSPVVISPDGRTLVYAAETAGLLPRLYQRRLDAFEPAVMVGTDGAESPFFSPGSAWVGFVANGQLKKVRLEGSDPVTIAPVGGLLLGVSWGADNSIVFSNSASTGLWRVSSEGGTARRLTNPAVSLAAGHRFPSQLPDGSGVLFSLTGASPELGVLPAGSNTWRTIAKAERRFTGMRYLPTGHLVYGQDGAIVAVGFDTGRMDVVGTPVRLVDGVQSSPVSQYVWYSVSDTGTLVYLPASAPSSPSQLVSISPKGVSTVIASLAGAGGGVRLAPDGKRAAVILRSSGVADAWSFDLERGIGKKVTSGLEIRYSTAWMPDGRTLAIATHEGLYAVDGSAGRAPTLLLGAENKDLVPLSWSPNGRHLLVRRTDPESGADILDFSPDRGTLAPVVASGADEWDAQFSPDGHWIAYTSNETGRYEVYVQPFAGSGAKERVSRNGGGVARWFRDGTRLYLYYWSGSKMLRVPVNTNPLRFGAVEPIDADSGFADITITAGYDVTADGSVLAVRTPVGTPEAVSLRVVLNWDTDLRQRVPVR